MVNTRWSAKNDLLFGYYNVVFLCISYSGLLHMKFSQPWDIKYIELTNPYVFDRFRFGSTANKPVKFHRDLRGEILRGLSLNKQRHWVLSNSILNTLRPRRKQYATLQKLSKYMFKISIHDTSLRKYSYNITAASPRGQCVNPCRRN